MGSLSLLLSFRYLSSVSSEIMGTDNTKQIFQMCRTKFYWSDDFFFSPSPAAFVPAVALFAHTHTTVLLTLAGMGSAALVAAVTLPT